MKLFIKILMPFMAMFMFASCSTYVQVSNLIGDVTWMNNNGEVVRRWNNATIQQTTSTTDGFSYASSTTHTPYKNGGWLSFFAEDGTSVSINGGMAIVENIREESEVAKVNNSAKIEEELESLKRQYTTCDEEYRSLEKKINDKSLSKTERDEAKKDRKKLYSLMNELANRYYSFTGKEISEEIYSSTSNTNLSTESDYDADSENYR
jgi:hypothetical protein